MASGCFIMMKQLMTTALFALLLLPSCMPEEDIGALPDDQKQYFDVKRLVDEQLASLEEQLDRLRISREVAFDGQVEATEGVAPQLEELREELSIFDQADLNKAILLGAYDSSVTENERGRVVTYTPKKNKPKVKKLSIAYQEGTVSSISAQLKDENFYYSASKNLEMRLKNGLVAEIEIEGQQKLIWRDPITYKVETKLRQAP